MAVSLTELGVRLIGKFLNIVGPLPSKIYEPTKIDASTPGGQEQLAEIYGIPAGDPCEITKDTIYKEEKALIELLSNGDELPDLSIHNKPPITRNAVLYRSQEQPKK